MDHVSHIRTKVTNEWSYTSTPLVCLMAWTETNLPLLFYFGEIRRKKPAVEYF